MQAATRMADGQWPWRDFGWSYGPGEPLVVMTLGKVFGPSLLWWRLLRVAADATAALLVYLLVRDRRPSWALPAWAAAAVTAAQPTSANPTGPALAFALGSVLAATRGRPGWAGVLAALAAFWRPDVGAIAALAAAATAPGAPSRTRGRERWRRRRAPTAGTPAAPLRGPAAPRRGGGLPRVAAAGLLVLYAPFLVAAGPGHVWDALVVQSTQDGEWWRLPFGLQRRRREGLRHLAASVRRGGHVCVGRPARGRAGRARRGRRRLLRLARGPRARAGAADRRGGRGGVRAPAARRGDAARAAARRRPRQPRLGAAQAARPASRSSASRSRRARRPRCRG